MMLARSDAHVRAIFLKRACGSSLLMPPSQAAILLKLFPKDLVLAGFGPALLERPPLGPLAAYILARLGITISPGDLPAVLAVTSESPGTLENLAHLIAPEHCDSVIEDLQTRFDVSKPGNRQLHDSFITVLKSERRSEPSEPTWNKAVADQLRSEQEPGSRASPDDQARQVPDKTDHPSDTVRPDSSLAQAQARLAGTYAKPAGQAKQESGLLPETIARHFLHIDKNIVIGIFALAISVPIVVYFSSSTPPETPEITAMPLTPEKAPKFWTDAVTKRQITHEFLAADNDFQMGEMFFIRQQYGEALSLFRDALSRDPAHVGAQFRIGCCLFISGDSQGATKAFQKSLQLQSDLPQANLYLARIAAAAQDWDKALAYYQKEFNLSGDILVALEYVEALRKLGRHPEAIALLSGLPPRYSGQLEVVNTLAQLREEAKEHAP